MEMSISGSPRSGAATPNRGVQLVAGIICMVMVANLQYGWTYFVDPMDQAHHWGREGIQIAFTHVRRHRDLAGAGRRLVRRPIRAAASWSLSAAFWSRSPGAQFDRRARCPSSISAAIISGIGAGAVYGTCVGNALKWFPDRRGLAAGLTAAGFGAGAAATVWPIIPSIGTTAIRRLSCGSASARASSSCVLAPILRAPQAGQVPARRRKRQSRDRDYTPVEMLKTPIF